MIEASGRLLDILFDRMPMGLAVIDRQFTVHRTNPTWTAFIDHYGAARATTVQPGERLFAARPRAAADLRPLLERAFAGETVRQNAVRPGRVPQSTYWDVMITPLDSDGPAEAALVVCVDATEREQTAITAERTRLARELHDAVTQTLFSASLIAEILPRIWERDEAAGRARLAELQHLTRGALAEMRTLLLELRPATLTESPLGDLLQQLADGVMGRSGLTVRVAVAGDGRLPDDVQLTLYRIAQESLNNVMRHAGATEVTLALRTLDDQAELTVADNGRGFDAADVGAGSLGLNIIRERLVRVRGELTIVSEIGVGTRLIARCPLPDASRDSPESRSQE